MRRIVFFLLFFSLGCATSKSENFGMADLDENSQAHGSAFLTDAIHIRKPMELSAPDWRPIRFYFKDCTEVGERFYYSKTSYDCTYP
ncbi:MAG: hypothetical protein CL677_04860 [Bdellovibrionaceae bacterium]|nr:hypothetical protein [Pseudobdellovibrionaceae bacterium]